MALTGQTVPKSIPESTPLVRGVMFHLPTPPCSYCCDEQQRTLALAANQVVLCIYMYNAIWVVPQEIYSLLSQAMGRECFYFLQINFEGE